MRKPFMRQLLCVGLCVASLSTAAVTASRVITALAAETSTQTTNTGDEDHKPPKDDDSVMAKVTSVSGSTITVTTAQKPGNGEKPADGQTPPEKPADGETPPEKPAAGETPPEKPADGETPPEKPADGETPPEKPADGQTPPEKPANDGTSADDSNRPEMNFDGETLTLTLTDSTEYTTRGGQSVSASDITEGSVLRLTLDGTTVVRADIMNE